MKLCDLDQRVIVPVVDDTRGGMRYEVEMSLGELLGKALEDFEPEIVEAAPVRHGHWIYKRGCWAECSECHHDYKDAYDLENSDNYCRHCGALMDGAGEART